MEQPEQGAKLPVKAPRTASRSLITGLSSSDDKDLLVHSSFTIIEIYTDLQKEDHSIMKNPLDVMMEGCNLLGT